MWAGVEQTYVPLLMTPHYWQLFRSQQADLLLLPPLNRDFARIQEWCNHWSMILNPNKTIALVVSKFRTMNPDLGDLVLSGVSIWASLYLAILGVKFDSWLTSKKIAWYCLSCLSKNWYFEVGEVCRCEHLCVASLLLCICSLNPWVLFLDVGVCCWMLSLASRVPGVIGGQALPWSDFLIIVSTSCCCTVYVVQG